MRKIKVGNITYFITAESWRLLRASRVDPVVVENHLVRDTFKSFLGGVMDERMRIAVLCAHGYYDAGVWVYDDKTKAYRVADWVRRQDGKYPVLLLFVCNAESARIQPTKRSVVVFPEGDIYFDIDEVITPGGDICHLPQDNEKLPREFLRNYTGPFYKNYPRLVTLTPKHNKGLPVVP